MNSPSIDSEQNLFELFYTRTPIGLCRKEGVCLFKSDDGDVCFAISDSTRPFVVDAMRRSIGVTLRSIQLDPSRLNALIDASFELHRRPQSEKAKPIAEPNDLRLVTADSGADLLQDNSNAPVIELVSQVCHRALVRSQEDDDLSEQSCFTTEQLIR